MIRKIGYFWSFILTWVIFIGLDAAGVVFFGFNQLSTEAKMIAAVVLVWATAKDCDARAAKASNKNYK